MLRYLKENNLFSLFVLMAATMLLRVYPAIHDYHFQFNTNAPLSVLLFNALKQIENYDLISNLLATVIVFLQALLVNLIARQHQILYKHSYLPGLMFVIFNSIYKEQLYFTPQLLSNTFLIFLVYRLCFLYEHKNAILPVFDSGAMLGIALLFNYDLIVMLPFILLSVITLTRFKIRYIFVSIIGIITPLYFLAGLFYLFNYFDLFIETVLQSFYKTYFKAFSIKLLPNLSFLIIAPVTLLGYLGIQQNFFKNNVKTRRLIIMLILMVAFSVLTLFIEDDFFGLSLCYASIPLSYFMAYFFLGSKRTVLKEILIWIIIALVITTHFIS
ncbi:MAG: DUF6427 family protein [Bacteroidia bacterium]